MTTCENCAYLAYEEPVSRDDVYSAHCCDPDKPMMGARRVVATSQVGRPGEIERPVWCKRKKERPPR